MTKLMAMVRSKAWTEQFTLANGTTMSNMARAWRHGLTKASTRVSTIKVKNRAKESSLGLTAPSTTENSCRTIYAAKVAMFGQTDALITVDGKTIKWKGLASTNGLMEESTRVTLLLT